MAIPKLSNVPIKIYSVSLTSWLLVRSPNRKTDLAANKKPTPSQWLSTMKTKTRILSIMPMYLPAALVVSFSCFHFDINNLITTEAI